MMREMAYAAAVVEEVAAGMDNTPNIDGGERVAAGLERSGCATEHVGGGGGGLPQDGGAPRNDEVGGGGASKHDEET